MTPAAHYLASTLPGWTVRDETHAGVGYVVARHEGRVVVAEHVHSVGKRWWRLYGDDPVIEEIAPLLSGRYPASVDPEMPAWCRREEE